MPLPARRACHPALISMVLLGAAAPAAAQDSDRRDINVTAGAGPAWTPAYPGARKSSLGLYPRAQVWYEGDPVAIEAPDEGFDVGLIGQRDRFAVGVVGNFAPRRDPDDVGAPVRKVGFGVEAGGFVEGWAGRHLRLRGEVRHGIGGHNALTADARADLVLRGKDSRLIATIGPRVRWSSAKYARAFFGTDAAEAAATGGTVDRPGAGIHAVGLVGGVQVPLTRRLGVYGFAGYDRLTGDAADSRFIARYGDRDQWMAGAALTWSFVIRR